MNKFFKKITSNQIGFSMVQIMIASAMAGGLALVIAKLGDNTNKTLKNAEIKTEYINTFYQISKTLRDEVNCGKILNGFDFTAALFDKRAPVLSIEKCGTTELQTLSGSTIKERVCQAGGYKTVFKVAPEVYGQGNYNLEFNFIPIEFVGTSTSTGFADLEVRFIRTEKAQKVAFGSKETAKRIRVLVELDPLTNKVIKCVNDDTNMINTAISRSCQGIHANLINTGTVSEPSYICEHDARYFTDVTVCLDDEYQDGFKFDSASSAPTEKLIPNCVKLTDKNLGCTDGQYIVQDAGSLHCESIPTCTGIQKLEANATTGKLTCVDFTGSCTNGKVLVVVGNEFQCKSIACTNNKLASEFNSAGTASVGTVGQQYFAGFDSNGDALCNPVVDGQGEVCPDGGRLAMNATGAVKYECCTQNCSDSGSFCSGASYKERDGCGYCVGSYTFDWQAGKTNDKWNETTQCGSGTKNRSCLDNPPAPPAGQPDIASCGSCQYLLPPGSTSNTNTKIVCPFIKSQFWTSNASWNTPSNMKANSIKVWMAGGGGGGGSGAGQEGGGGGGTARTRLGNSLNTTPSTSCSITIGGGGRGAGASEEHGGDWGGTSSVNCGGVIISAGGGSAGGYRSSGGTTGHNGGSMGTKTNAGGYFSTTNLWGGSGGAGGSRRNVGRAASNYGSGGGGGGGGNHSGNTGSQGILYMQWKEY